MYWVTERLMGLVNRELLESGYSIKSFSTKCEISYDEMRRIVNGSLVEPKISTIEKICENSTITLSDVLCVDTELDNQTMIVQCNSGKYNLTWKKVK